MPPRSHAPERPSRRRAIDDQLLRSRAAGSPSFRIPLPDPSGLANLSTLRAFHRSDSLRYSTWGKMTRNRSTDALGETMPEEDRASNGILVIGDSTVDWFLAEPPGRSEKQL